MPSPTNSDPTPPPPPQEPPGPPPRPFFFRPSFFLLLAVVAGVLYVFFWPTDPVTVTAEERETIKPANLAPRDWEALMENARWEGAEVEYKKRRLRVVRLAGTVTTRDRKFDRLFFLKEEEWDANKKEYVEREAKAAMRKNGVLGWVDNPFGDDWRKQVAHQGWPKR